MNANKMERRFDVDENYEPPQGLDDQNAAAYRRWGFTGYVEKPAPQTALDNLEETLGRIGNALDAWQQRRLAERAKARHKQLEAIVDASARRVFMNANGDLPEPRCRLREKLGQPERDDSFRARILGK